MLLQWLSLLILVCTHGKSLSSLSDTHTFSRQETEDLRNIISDLSGSNEEKEQRLNSFFSSDQRKMEIDMPDNGGLTALQLACFYANSFAVTYLRRNGAKHTATRGNGDYPIHLVENTFMLETLLQEFPEIDIDVKNFENKTLKDVIERKIEELRQAIDSERYSQEMKIGLGSYREKLELFLIDLKKYEKNK